MELNIDRVLSVLGLASGLLGLWLAYFFYKKSIRTKVLALGYSNPLPLMLPIEEIKVSYLGSEQKALSRVFVLLWNRGTAPIESGDFITPITFQEKEKILAVKIKDKDGAAKATVNETEKTVTITLLRPGEAIILQIDATDVAYRANLSVDMKAPEMSVKLGMTRDVLAAVIALAIGAALFFSMLFFGSAPDFGFEKIWIRAALDFGFLIFSFLVACIVSVLVNKGLEKYFSARTTAVAWRFFGMQIAVLDAFQTWTKLKKKIDQVSQK